MPALRKLFLSGALFAVLGCTSATPTTPSPAAPTSGPSVALPTESPQTTQQTNPPPTATTAQPTSTAAGPVPTPGVAWQSVLDSIGEDGTVSKDTAVQAFSLAIGPLPGASVPAGDAGHLQSGTMAVRWLESHWDELTPEQQQAAIGMLPELGPLNGQAGLIMLASQNRSNDVYTQMAQQAIADIGANLQSSVNFGLTVSARVGLPVSATAAAETSVLDANGGKGGAPAKCVIVVSPAGDKEDNIDIQAVITHEAWHCYEGAIVGLASYWSQNPAPWITEGEAEWVAASIVPYAAIMSQPWPLYLNYPQAPLFTDSYDAIGFYSHMEETGTDPWTKLVDILKAPDNKTAFVAAGADQDPFLDSWASGFLRDPGRGDPWEVSGPAITNDKPPPGGIHLANDGSVSVTVAPYTNEIDVFGETPDVLQAEFSGHARVSDSNGHDYLAIGATNFCMLLTGCVCPNSTDPPPFPLEGDAVALAVTGGPAGSSGTLVGTSLDDFCSNLTGTWTGTWINSPDFGTPQANGGFTMTLTQTGKTFSGTVSVTGPTCVRDGTVNGTVASGNVQFGWITDVARPVQFEGTFSKNSMSGTWNAISCEPLVIPIYGDWSATRSKSP